MVIYGPGMSRSMYTGCKQILNREILNPERQDISSSKNIVDTVEKQ